MPVRLIDSKARLGVQRGGVVVCIPLPGAPERLTACLRTVLAHTADDVPIVVCGGSAQDPTGLESLQAVVADGAGERELLYLNDEDQVGPAAAVIAASALVAPADVALLCSDCAVAAHWLEDLRGAAYADSRVATASAVRHDQLEDLDDAAATVRSRSLRLRPRLDHPTGSCVYVRRSALELAGPIDSAFVGEPGKQSEFSSRCVRSGLSHTLADDVLVFDPSPGSRKPPGADATDGSGPLARSLSRVRRALGGLSVVIDARILSGPPRGTQIQVMEAIAALARTEQVGLTAVVPDSLGEDAAQTLQRVPGLSLVTHDQAAGATGRKADLVHRPFQVGNPGDLAFLLRLGDRLVVTQEDLIGYYNPSYFASPEAWQGYRRLTRTVLAVADRVLFVSDHARHDAVADELVDPARATVVPNGVDHQATRMGRAPARPPGATALPDDAEVMLCLGTNYRHKNRPFALRVVEELRRRHDWGGRLVFAGARVAHGASARDEECILHRALELADAVIDLGPVSEAEKAWLLDRAGLVIYPTVHEGFGLVPFEAADHGVPCMWAAGTSLSEVLPDRAAEIVAWDPALSADRALALLRDAATRGANIEAIRNAGARLTWDDAARRLIELYEITCDSSSASAATLARRDRLLTGGMSEDALRLMGPAGALPADMQRPLLALATHPRIGTPLFRALRFGYRTSFKLRRAGRDEGSQPDDRGSEPDDRQSFR